MSQLNKIFYENIDSIKSWGTLPFGPLAYSLVHSNNPNLIIETGTNSGYITAYIAKACIELKNKVFFTIDWYNKDHAWLYENIEGQLDKKVKINLEKCGVSKGVTKFISHEVISYLLESEEKGLFKELKLGLVFIDDCHEQDHVYKEMEIFWRNLVPGGIMALHDVQDVPAVNHAVDDFTRNYGIYRKIWFFISAGCILIQKDW